MKEQNKDIFRLTRIQNIYFLSPFSGQLQLEERQTETNQEIAFTLLAGSSGWVGDTGFSPQALLYYLMCCCERCYLDKK